MHWEILIIPLIALGVWILGTLFRTGEADKTKPGVRRPGSAPRRGPGRRPVTDLDRFLEEARRRREEEERPKPPPPRPAVTRPPLRERPTQPRETPVRVAPPVVRAPEAPVALPVARPIERPARPEPVPVAAPARVAPSLLPPPPAARPEPTTPILQQVRSLLQQPQTAGTAFVLREIFDPPLCKRRR